MTRTEVNISTGEVRIIELTAQEIAAFEEPADPVPSQPTADQLKSVLSAAGMTDNQITALFDAAKKITA